MKKVSSRHMRGAFEKWARASQILLATSSARTVICEPSFRVSGVRVTWRAIFAKALHEGGILSGRGPDRKRQDGPAAREGQGFECLLIVYPHRKCYSWTRTSSHCVSHRERNSYVVYVRHHWDGAWRGLVTIVELIHPRPYIFQTLVHGSLIYTVIYMSDRLLTQANPNLHCTPPPPICVV